MSIAGFTMDILLIVMLGVMIFYVTRLHKRLEVIRSGRGDLETLLRDLVNSTARAERGLIDLRSNAEVLAQTLQKQITGAGRAREELEYLLSSADRVADTLMDRIGNARTAVGGTVPPVSARDLPREEPRAELKEKLAATSSAPVLEPIAPAPSSIAAAAPAPKPQVASANAREAAESDLLRAIEKLR